MRMLRDIVAPSERADTVGALGARKSGNFLAARALRFRRITPSPTRGVLPVNNALYGSGLRLLEALMLRVKEVDFARGQLTIRDPKWKDLACGWGEVFAVRCDRSQGAFRVARSALEVGISSDTPLARRGRPRKPPSSARRTLVQRAETAAAQATKLDPPLKRIFWSAATTAVPCRCF
jgi:hypothetical protein